jgi:uncharacterized protein (DUF488 family)
MLPLPTDPVSVQIQNKEEWNKHRSQHDADFYTISYAGRTIEELIHALKNAGVATVVDVRHAPISAFKPDFSKINLNGHLKQVDIDYLHLPQLGIPREVRGLAIGKRDRRDLWDWYDRYIVEQFAGRNLHYFFNFANHPIALMCLEIDPTSCHRHRLVIALERLGLSGFDL